MGCGEGYWVLKWVEEGLLARGSDFSSQIIEIAKTNAIQSNLPEDIFRECSIYELSPDRDRANLVVCCEVLEHLENPYEALRVLQSIIDPYLILSVPGEPVWKILNVARGKYWRDFGNTPGHIQSWSRKGFERYISAFLIYKKSVRHYLGQCFFAINCRHKWWLIFWKFSMASFLVRIMFYWTMLFRYCT